MNKDYIFFRELSFIKDEKVKEFTKLIINKLPDYFFTCAASSTGKYHPAYSLLEGGLVMHTKAATRIAYELLRLDMFEKLINESDYIISALILHDGFKHGLIKNEYTVAEHPKIMAEFILENGGNLEISEKVASLIHSHMGQWNTGYGQSSSIEILPKPNNASEKFVHLCDYLASRKQIEFNFDV